MNFLRHPLYGTGSSQFFLLVDMRVLTVPSFVQLTKIQYIQPIPQRTPTSLEPTHAVLELPKHIQWELLRQPPISRRTRMQTVARIIRSIHLCCILRITENQIKVQNCIKRPTVPNPVIHTQPRLLSQGSRVSLQRAIITAKGRDGGPEKRNLVRMYARDHLFVCLDDPIARLRLRGDFVGRRANVVDALEHHGVLDAAVRQHVAVNAAQSIGTQTVVEDPVTACRLVDDADVLRGTLAAHASVQQVRPASVGVVVAASSIGNGVTNNGKSAR